MKHVLFIVAATVLAMPVAAQKTPAAPAQVGADKDKLICKREVPVGSLIASRKTCMTKAQWEAQARDGNDEARRMVEMNQGRPTGN
jgi:hypothetical protein